MAYSSKLANALLATPFDDQSVVSPEVSKQLTKEEFCSKCYSHPRFKKEEESYSIEDSNNSDDILITYNEIRNQMHQQRIAYDNFNLWLSNFENNKIYTINGNAGTGKTTFINYKKYMETEIEWIILDIYRARSFVEWVADVRTDISNFEQAKSKVYGSIMNKLWELLFQGLDENGNYSLQKVNNTLSKLTKNYENYYAYQYPSGRKLLEEISVKMNSNRKGFSKIEKVAEIFQKYVNGKMVKINQNDNQNDNQIINILNILLLTVRCLFENPEKKFIIVFDNFERFISQNEIYNGDIDAIRLLLTSYIRNINEEGNVHKGHFKFVMAVRDSTARMCGVKLHVSDTEPSNLDLGEWYDIQDIISLKTKWYTENKIPVVSSELVEQIVGDSRICNDQTVTGLKLLIDPLFNSNKRLIIDFIGSMVESPNNKKWIEDYINLWNENTSHSRFAARSIIRGMILNELEGKADKLFEHLKTYSNAKVKNGIGDARKILTILYNNAQRSENEMSLISVLNELFNNRNIKEIWNNSIIATKRKTICEILFYMNSYNRRENDWIQFIDIQLKKSNCSIVVEDASKLEEVLSNNMENYTIHLMPAGEAYLRYIVASFEFFSLRYTQKYAPLFTLIPTPEEVSKCITVKELPCYKKIACVVKRAGDCIGIMKIRKEDTIKLSDNRYGKYHYTRIINQHRAYIDAFAKYIKDKYCSTEDIDETVKIKYERLCREIIKQRKVYDEFEKLSSKSHGK